MKKLLALSMALLLTTSLFVGCGSKEEESTVVSEAVQEDAQTEEETKPETEEVNIELSLMHFATKESGKTDARAAAIQNQMEIFQTENPNITLENSEMSHDDYQVKIQQLAATDDMPDIFMLKGSWIESFEENQLMDDISQDIANYEYKDDYVENIFKIATRDDKIYGLPFEANTSTTYVFYNKEMWKAAGYDTFPTTWEEVIAANEYFKAQGIPMIGLGNKDKWPVGSSVLSTLGDRFTGSEWTQSIISNDGSAKFTDPEFIAALDLLSNLAADEAFNADFNSVNNNQTQALFRQGKYSCVIEGAWAMTGILGECSDEMLNKIGIAPLPMPENAKGEANSSAGGAGWFFAINGNLEGAEREAAIDLLFNLCGKEFSEVIANNNAEPTPSKVEIDTTNLPQIQKDYLEQNAGYNIIPVYDVWMKPAVIEAMNTSMQGLLAGTKTSLEVAEAIQEAQEKE